MRSATRKATGKNKAYLAFIASLPCLCCQKAGIIQVFRTEVAHVGMRGLSQKCADWETIPLCGGHHRLGAWSHHAMGRRFWKKWGLSRQKLFLELARRFAERGPND